ncbi:MAG TPA: HlyD family secretion protein [Acetobacteraceae bacterium]|jgi:membrane fusion protein, multidrug efflux system|nr:HlyD family secretion protein [Acetobacteraceae bacterium]
MDDLSPEREAMTPNASYLPKQGGRKRVVGPVIGILVVLGMIGAGTMYWLSTRDFETTDDAFVDAYTTQMAPRVGGQVTKLLFADNQHVSAGQMLLQIDPADYQAKLDQAKAQQASAVATLEQAGAQVAVQQANVDQAAANVRVAEAELLQARQDYDRYRTIAAGAVSRQQIEAATATFHAAEAKVDASRQTVGGARAQVRAAQAQVLAAEASLNQAAANTHMAELQLSYCTLVAPVAGIVTHRTVSTGNYVNPGQALFALVQDGRWVTANFKETQLADIRAGQDVELAIDAVSSVRFHGKVDSFQAGTGSAFSVLPSENATGNYVKIVQRLPVKIVFDDDRLKDHSLMPGMSVTPSVRVR